MKALRTLSPIDDMLDVLVGVFKVFHNSLAVRVEPGGFRRLSGLERHAPGSVLDTRSEVTRQGILLHVSKCSHKV